MNRKADCSLSYREWREQCPAQTESRTESPWPSHRTRRTESTSITRWRCMNNLPKNTETNEQELDSDMHDQSRRHPHCITAINQWTVPSHNNRETAFISILSRFLFKTTSAVIMQLCAWILYSACWVKQIYHCSRAWDCRTVQWHEFNHDTYSINTLK